MPHRYALGRQLERVFAEIVAAVELGLYVYQVDDPEDPGSLRLVYANPASAISTGVDVATILDHPLRETFPNLLETPLPATCLEIALGGAARDLGEIEYADSRVARQTFAVRAFPLPDRRVGVSFTNLTGQRLAEQQAVQTLETMTDAFLTLDREWRFTYLNPQSEALLERRREDLIGKSLWDEFPAAVGSQFEEEYRRAVRDDCAVRFEATYEPLGRTVAVRAYPVSGGLAIYYTDVTQERLVEAQLRQAQRLEAIGRVTAGVAHDFNNLLTVIHGYAALGETSSTDAGAAQYFGEIAAAGQRATELTKQLLAFGREQQLAPAAIDLNEVVNDFASLLHHLVSPELQLRLDLAPAPVIAFADRAQLEQVVLNLVVNARDATERGSVTIRTSSSPLGTHASTLNGRGVWLQVVDTGTGITDDVLPRIFDPFFTTKAAGTGTGLGLASVHGIVGQSGGEVFVDSCVGEGTTMTVVLPTGPA